MTAAKILLVDDEADLRSLLARVLLKEGYEVDEVDSGNSAVETFQQKPPDLVLLDLYLPDLNGLQVLERIHKISSAIPVVMMTGHGEISTAVESMKLGAIDYLLKPFPPERLKNTVRSILQREGPPARGGVSDRIIGQSPRMREVWTDIERYALPDVSVLLCGESGTGKELFARAIHERSKRRDKPFVALDCATLPDTLVESEIFGHEKGAFTGALERRIGKFEHAHGGTLLLDEIGNLLVPVQAKLLRVLQERTIDRLGGQKPIPVDVRIVSATNLDLVQATSKGAFRSDLYYRLAEVVINLPPLREREGDVAVLAKYFVSEFNRRFGRNVRGISDATWALLGEYRWPGNVRELENVMKSSVLTAEEYIEPAHLPDYLRRGSFSGAPPAAPTALSRERIQNQVDAALTNGFLDLKAAAATYAEEMEKELLVELLGRRRFTQAELSRLLRVDPKTLRAKLQRFNLKTR